MPVCCEYLVCVHMAGQPVQELSFALEPMERAAWVSMGAYVAAQLPPGPDSCGSVLEGKQVTSGYGGDHVASNAIPRIHSSRVGA